MFEGLNNKLEKALHTLKGHGKITEINVAETVKEVRRALLSADVNFTVAKTFTDMVKKRAIGEKVLSSLRPNELMIKIVNDELTKLMGSRNKDINIDGSPAVILISGMQGSGKTTFSGKLANFLKSKKKKTPLLVACDVYRPAAVEQLKIIGEQAEVEVFYEQDNKNPVSIAENAISYAKKNNHNVVVIDTAGRLAIDEQMMDEISSIHKRVNPSETLFVVDSMTGQDAVNTAKVFNDHLNFDGVVLTKLDGDTRGGAALSIKYVVDKPIKFVGTGEKLKDLDVFYPDRMANRILGMGDIVSLVEKAQEEFDKEEFKKLSGNIARNTFSFEDFLKHIQHIKKMGGVKHVMGMMPGMGKMSTEIGDVDHFKTIEAIIGSMTPKERKLIVPISKNRKHLIASGSGTSIQDLNQLLKQFEQIKKVMKLFNNSQKGGMNNLMQMMGIKR
ncbi:signal recognition particle protein [Ichthyobacterium seriolicida]|uniref:Signal recognition particle protein n=1 Tax=Ichthyobacterium seriolicida TaxID=242600 RepID=A0A1J1E6G7_9FLAO|nr:signal recognition particle protein [Ichthyobacterium seriolicida]BAV94918.1 signal recognition particle, subunit Ffh SRP54 [Ichthyobacterium seriolicida]